MFCEILNKINAFSDSVNEKVYEFSVKTDNSENTDKKIRDASNIDFAGGYDHLQTKNHSFKYISKEEIESAINKQNSIDSWVDVAVKASIIGVKVLYIGLALFTAGACTGNPILTIIGAALFVPGLLLSLPTIAIFAVSLFNPTAFRKIDMSSDIVDKIHTKVNSQIINNTIINKKDNQKFQEDPVRYVALYAEEEKKRLSKKS